MELKYLIKIPKNKIKTFDEYLNETANILFKNFNQHCNI